MDTKINEQNILKTQSKLIYDWHLCLYMILKFLIFKVPLNLVPPFPSKFMYDFNLSKSFAFFFQSGLLTASWAQAYYFPI